MKLIEKLWPLVTFIVVGLVSWWTVDRVAMSVDRLEDKVESQIGIARMLMHTQEAKMGYLSEEIEGADCVVRRVETCQLPDESYADFLDRHDKAVAAVIERYGQKKK